MSNQPSSPEPLWLLSEPWPAGQTQLLGCVRNQTSVFAGGIESQKASLHGSPWSLTCSYFEPTNSHQDALWDVISLCCAAYMPFLSCWLNPLSPSLSPDLISVSSPLLISFSLWFSCSFFFFTTFILLSFSLYFFLPLFLPTSHSSNSPKHLHCNTLRVSQTPRGGVQLVHYVSWVFVRLMENTQNALAFHHSTGKRNSVHILPS